MLMEHSVSGPEWKFTKYEKKKRIFVLSGANFEEKNVKKRVS